MACGGKGGVRRRGSAPLNILRQKAELRRRMRSEDRAPGPAAAAAVQETVMAMKAFGDARRVACYSPIGGEVALDSVVLTCRRDNREISLPVTLPSGEYGFMTWEAGSALATGRFGIPEPCGGETRLASDLDIVLVPGVAFDRFGGRVGRGGGFYDRLLAGRHGGKPFIAGLTFSWRLVERVPMGPNDVAVDCVVTEQGIAGGAMPPWKREGKS
jgi:5-formyltetrahydrofolate cyclo-ligase